MDTTTPPKRIEIARFPANKRFAITTSWDDGTIEDRKLVPWMNENGLKGTFNLNSLTHKNTGQPSVGSDRIDLSEIEPLYRGHEVAIHCSTHPWLDRLDASQIAFEVLEDRRMLEDIVGYPVRGMAYPFGAYSPHVIEILKALGIVYSRTCNQLDPMFPPKEPLELGTTAHMYTEKDGLDVGQRFLKLHENPRATGVYYVWGHSFEFARPNGDRWPELEKRFKPLCGHSDVWYCTNIELFDYEAARQRVVIAANKKFAFNPSALTVTLLVDGKAVDVAGGATVRVN